MIRTPILTGGQYGRTIKAGLSDEQILKQWQQLRPMPPEKFAERAIRAVLRGDAIIVVPAWWKVFWYLERLSPSLSMRLTKRALTRMRELQSTAQVRDVR